MSDAVAHGVFWRTGTDRKICPFFFAEKMKTEMGKQNQKTGGNKV